MGNKHFKTKKINAGTTLIEIVVSFALLGIFLASAAMIISTIANSYFGVKGETYSKQVTDIVLEKVASTIEGAKYDDEKTYINPAVSNNYTRITLRDRTNTKVTMYADDGRLRLFYAQIIDENDSSKDREPTIWSFDDALYNGYSIEELFFVPGDELESFEKKSDFGMNTTGREYGSDVVVIFMKLYNPKYEDYYTYRVVKMYYVPDKSTDNNAHSG